MAAGAAPVSTAQRAAPPQQQQQHSVGAAAEAVVAEAVAAAEQAQAWEQRRQTRQQARQQQAEQDAAQLPPAGIKEEAEEEEEEDADGEAALLRFASHLEQAEIRGEVPLLHRWHAWSCWVGLYAHVCRGHVSWGGAPLDMRHAGGAGCQGYAPR